MRSRKKAQFYGQVFVYILMIIVFGGVLLFGFRAIKGLMDRGSQIELRNFEIEVRKIVDSNMHYGTTEVKVLNIPGDYKEICFIDQCAYKELHDQCNFGTEGLDETDWDNKFANGVQGLTHFTIQDSLRDYSQSNVYLYPKKKDDDFIVGPLEVLHQEELKKYTTVAGATPSIFSGTQYENIVNERSLPHVTSASRQNFICMQIVDTKVKIKLKGLGNRVQIIQVPFDQ